MSIHESFETQKNKIEKTWNRTKDSKDDIEQNVKIIDINYRSNHFNKKILAIDLLKDFLIPTATSPAVFTTMSFSFKNLSKALITNSQLLIELKSNNPTFDFDKLLVSQPFPLSLKDIWIERSSIKHWWEQNDNFSNLFIKFNVSFQRVISLDPPISQKKRTLDVYADVKLYIINERNLNLTQCTE